jgi:NAD-dependent SIR2 family protein deacetylase
MFSNGKITTATGSYADNLARLEEEIRTADAIVIGAGAGLSTAAGFLYSGERFEKNFADFEEKYGFHDMYAGGFYPYETPEESWAFWSRMVFVNRYEEQESALYKQLLALVNKKNYFVLTTNVDHWFQKTGFDKRRLFYTQGDYGLFQCSTPCCNETYDNEQMIRDMVAQQREMKIPTKLIPKCPRCGKPMTMNLRSDDKFVQDEGWYRANDRYNDFIRFHKNLHVLYLELGVGLNTPVIIKYPFWKMTAENPHAVYACINSGETFCPIVIANRSICIRADIAEIFKSFENV